MTQGAGTPSMPGFRVAPQLMLVTDRALCPVERLPEVVAACVRSGVDAVQLRDRDLSRDERLALARALREATRGSALLIVNGDPDIAAAVEADGVHLPEGEGSVADARARGGWAQDVGRSVHSVAAAVAAEREGADLLVVGTVFPSRSHPGGPTGGLDLLRQVRGAVRVPVVAIGGITAANAGDVVRAGRCGVAVISAILAAPDPARAAAELRAAVDAAREERVPSAAERRP